MTRKTDIGRRLAPYAATTTPGQAAADLETRRQAFADIERRLLNIHAGFHTATLPELEARHLPALEGWLAGFEASVSPNNWTVLWRIGDVRHHYRLEDPRRRR